MGRRRRGARARAVTPEQFAEQAGRAAGRRAWPNGDRTARASRRLRDAVDVADLHAGQRAPALPLSVLQVVRRAAARRCSTTPSCCASEVDGGRRACWRCSASTPTRCAAASTSCCRQILSAAPGARDEPRPGGADPARSRRRRSTRVGVLDLETFFPPRTLGLAMRLNNLLASPASPAGRRASRSTSARLLYTPEGKPRLSILSIAHLSDAERMFFVTLLLNEMLAWMRAQPGTTSLRALLYMDEVFGYFPPTANPPAKTPHADAAEAGARVRPRRRAGDAEPGRPRLQGAVERRHVVPRAAADRARQARVLEGLEGAASAAVEAFDRAAMEQTARRRSASACS